MRLPSSFEEGEFSLTAYHDLVRQQAIFAEHAAVSAATHPCPYIAYFGPIHPSSSNSGGSVPDGSSFNNHWNGPPVPSEMPTSYAFPAMDAHYHSWEHHSSPFPTSSSRGVGGDQPSIPSVTQRAARPNSDIPRSGSFVHPFLVGHSSATRAGSSMVSSMIPPHPGSVARARDRVQALQAYFQQPSNSPPTVRTPAISGTRRSNTRRGAAQPVASSSDQTGGFFFFPSASSGRNFQEAENPTSSNRFHAWERDHSTSFSSIQADRDLGWGQFHVASGGSDVATFRSTGYHHRQRYGSERMPSQNQS